MMQITPNTKIMLALKPVDFRKGIDGLAGLCRGVLKQDPFSGILFVFRNRKGTSLKCLYYDGQGFWLCQKRLSKGRIVWWPKAGNPEEALLALHVHQIQLLLWNGDLSTVKQPLLWRPIKN